MMDLTYLNNENLDECGKAIFTLTADNGGEDNIFTHLEQSKSAATLGIKEKVYIKGCIKRIPRDIIRQISYNCRLQKVSSTVRYELQSVDIYTPEKMDEIERIFHSKNLYLNGHKIQFEGGTVFEPISDNFPNEFRLRVVISECEQRQIFGCVKQGLNVLPNVDDISFGVPDNAVTDVFFSDNGVRVANDYFELLDYFSTLENVVKVTDVDVDLANTDVPFKYIFTVERSGYVPTSFYYNKVSAANKVYGVILSEPDNYNELSRGMNSGGDCEAPEIGTVTVTQNTCDAPIIGETSVSFSPCDVLARNGWYCHDDTDNNVKYVGGQRLLNMRIFNDNVDTGLEETIVKDIAAGSTVCSVTPDNPVNPDAFWGIKINDVLQPDDYTVTGDVSINISPCLDTEIGDEIQIIYREYNLQPQLIGYIDGECYPLSQVVFTDPDGVIIPVGATVTIETNGAIYYEGVPFDAEAMTAEIRIVNLPF